MSSPIAGDERFPSQIRTRASRQWHRRRQTRRGTTHWDAIPRRLKRLRLGDFSWRKQQPAVWFRFEAFVQCEAHGKQQRPAR